jgi:hypothetical protein
VSVKFSGGALARQPSSKGGGLCIGEEITGAPMWRWKKSSGRSDMRRNWK